MAWAPDELELPLLEELADEVAKTVMLLDPVTVTLAV